MIDNNKAVFAVWGLDPCDPEARERVLGYQQETYLGQPMTGVMEAAYQHGRRIGRCVTRVSRSSWEDYNRQGPHLIFPLPPGPIARPFLAPIYQMVSHQEGREPVVEATDITSFVIEGNRCAYYTQSEGGPRYCNLHSLDYQDLGHTIKFRWWREIRPNEPPPCT